MRSVLTCASLATAVADVQNGAAASGSCSTSVGKNNDGVNLVSTAKITGSAAECCDACSSAGGCAGYTWVHANNECWLKRSVDAPRDDECGGCVTSGSVDGPTPPPPPTPPTPPGRFPLAPVTPGPDAHSAGWSNAGPCEGHAGVAGEKSARLLGSTLRMKVNVGNTGCGCVTGIYLVEWGDGSQCDASGTFGGRCGEIDLMEGNKFGWHSTLHNAQDHAGLAGGLGGVQQPDMKYGVGPRDMSAQQYGPGASVVDTNHEFNVAISFPEAPGGALRDMIVMMWQDGKENAVEWRVNKRRADSSRNPALSCQGGDFNKPGCTYGQDDMHTFGQWLSNGMTPLATFWDGGGQQTWLDGTMPGEGGNCQLTSSGQPGTENLGSYNNAGCGGGGFSINSWSVEKVQNEPGDWDSYFAAMDANPVVSQHPPPPTPPTPPPTPPTPPPTPTPTPSDCPGGSLGACIALCPGASATVYQICVDTCLERCSGSIV